MSHRKAQIESALKRAVSKILIEEMSDPRVTGMISVTRVEVTPDLREAFVYITVLPEKLGKKTLAGLNHAQRFIQGKLDDHIVLHHPPRLQFRLDTQFQKQMKTLNALSRLSERERTKQDADQDQQQASNASTSNDQTDGDSPS